MMADRAGIPRVGAPFWPARLGRRAARGAIRVYQLSLSALIGRTCRYLPTCSDYADEAIARFGVWKGGWLALARISRCHPLGADGHDPVPEDVPLTIPWYKPWLYGRWSGRHIANRLGEGR